MTFLKKTDKSKEAVKRRERRKSKKNNAEKISLKDIKSGIDRIRANAKNQNIFAAVTETTKDYLGNVSIGDKSSAVFVYVGLLAFFEIFLVLFGVVSFFILRSSILYIPVWLSIIMAVVPFIVWVWSTTLDEWCYINRKKNFFYLCYMNVFLLIINYIYRAAYNLVVPAVEMIPYTLFLDSKGHRLLATGGIFYICLAFGLLIGYAFFNNNFYSLHLIISFIENFKLSHYIDARENKENLYDFSILNDLDSGRLLSVKENDRFTGTLVNGQSGTGKTSTIFTTSVGDDLQKKLHNLENLKAALHDMVLSGQIKLKDNLEEPLTHANEFDPFAFESIGKDAHEIKENETAYRKALEKFPNCGITAIAPNAGLPGDIIKLCNKLNLKVNVIDPMPDEHTGKYKDNYTGINPFYVNPDMSELEKVEDIANKAAIFAEIMAAINDESGKTDGYFADINKSVTISVCIINMVCIPEMLNRQPNIFDMQASFNDFDTLVERVKFMEDKYGEVPVKEPDKKERKGQNKQNADNVTDSLSEIVGEERQSIELDIFDKKGTCNTRKVGKMLKKGRNPYYTIIQTAKKELLGSGREKMEDQSRGLRTQLNNFLINPHINRIFSYTENVLDFDRIFREGEITVVNTALELGDAQSKAFGLYFILLFRQSMLRRPTETRICRHWCYIDELPVYLHPRLETLYSLARQYRCGFYSAIQTLDQMEKNATTKYLKGVLLGAGTHIVFGRVNSTEMRLYSELAGIKLQEHVKYSSSKSSILEDSGNYSSSETHDYSNSNVLEGYKIRNRDFSEVTFFTSDNGNVQEVRSAKSHFIDMSKFENVVRKEYVWRTKSLRKQIVDTVSLKKEEKGNKLDLEPATLFEDIIISPDTLESDMMINVSTETLEEHEPDRVVVNGPHLEEPQTQTQIFDIENMTDSEWNNYSSEGALSTASNNSSSKNNEVEDVEIGPQSLENDAQPEAEIPLTTQKTKSAREILESFYN